MKVKFKLCSCGCGMSGPLYSKKMLKGCYMRLHPEEFRIKRSPIKRKRVATGELELFREIWEEREHVSYLSGKRLYEFNVCLFAHVIAKREGEQWRLMKENIILLTPEEHTLLDQGTAAQRRRYAEENNVDWSIIYKLKEELKNKYQDYGM